MNGRIGVVKYFFGTDILAVKIMWLVVVINCLSGLIVPDIKHMVVFNCSLIMFVCALFSQTGKRLSVVQYTTPRADHQKVAIDDPHVVSQ